jgi:amidase
MEAELEEATIAELQARMTSGEVSAAALTQAYLDRITTLDQAGPRLGAVIEINPDAQAIADRLDGERRSSGPRSAIHGIPILIKDNIDTGDRMMTTAGSLALLGHRARHDASVVRRLREAGAVVLGKLNLSEWANFRSPHSTSGWSARGGQCRNPYSLERTPLGSSAGSGVAASANLATATLGTETDGSIVLPAAASGVVGIKPTVGLTSRAGVIPVAQTQDSVGPLARTVADAACLLSAIAGPDGRDPATAHTRGSVDYTRYLDESGMRGARIGVARSVYFGYSEKADRIIEEALGTIRALGAEVIDPADIPSARQLTFLGSETTVLLYEFKAGINAYLSQVDADVRVHSLADLIRFNDDHKADEMPYFGQEFLLMAEEKGSLQDAEYRSALSRNQRLARQEGIDLIMDRHSLDALIMPTTSPPWKRDLIVGDNIKGMGSTPAAQAGYPLITVPAGFVHDLPVGLLFTGRAYSEPTLIRLAYAFEQATKHRRVPGFLASTPMDDLAGYRAFSSFTTDAGQA